jgi:hypothetical protein
MGGRRKNRNKKDKVDAQATLDFLTGADRIAQNLVPAKGPRDGSIKYDKESDEMTIKNPDGEEIKIRPEKPIEPDTLPVDESDFSQAVQKLKLGRQDILYNPMRDLKLVTNKDTTIDCAVGKCFAIITPNFWRKIGADSWRCNLLSLVEGDMFSDIKVTPLCPFDFKAKIVLAVNATAVCEVPISQNLVPFPSTIPRFAILSCCIELVVEGITDPSFNFNNLTFMISHDTYMMGETLKKRWLNRLDAQLYLESNYDVHREYVIDITYGNVKRIIPGNRTNYKSISDAEETKKREQLAVLKKAREENRPDFSKM